MKFTSPVKRLATLLVAVVGIFNLQGANAQSLGFVQCESNGLLFAQCAATWERVFSNGNKMDDAMTTWAAGSFQSFVSGAASATFQKRWCPTEPFSFDMLSAVSAKFIREHPERWNTQPVELVLAPLAQAFPCSQK